MNEHKITAEMLNTMRPELNEAVKAVADKYGVKIHFGNARYTELTATYTVELSLAANGDFDPDKQLWDQNCKALGLTPEDFGKTVTLNGRLFRICGIRPRATVNSVLVLDIKKNKEFVASPDAIRKAWAGQQ